jgi:hypothetical protein
MRFVFSKRNEPRQDFGQQAIDPGHALTVDIGHLEVRNLGHPQARAIGATLKAAFVLGSGRDFEEARYILRAQLDQGPAQLVPDRQRANEAGPVRASR